MGRPKGSSAKYWDSMARIEIAKKKAQQEAKSSKLKSKAKFKSKNNTHYKQYSDDPHRTNENDNDNHQSGVRVKEDRRPDFASFSASSRPSDIINRNHMNSHINQTEDKRHQRQSSRSSPRVCCLPISQCRLEVTKASELKLQYPNKSVRKCLILSGIDNVQASHKTMQARVRYNVNKLKEGRAASLQRWQQHQLQQISRIANIPRHISIFSSNRLKHYSSRDQAQQVQETAATFNESALEPTQEEHRNDDDEGMSTLTDDEDVY